MSDEFMIRAENVSKKFCKELKHSLRYGVMDIAGELNVLRRRKQPSLRPREFWALKDVSFKLRSGEALGLIGPNGAGKSTLLKLLNGLMKPDTGSIVMRGRVGALIQLGAGFNPTLTGLENIFINAAVLGLSAKQTELVVEEIIEFAGVREFIDAPVQNYSSGMFVRLGYAIAAHLNPEILLVDEVLAVGDLAFRRKCLQHMQGYLKRGGTLVLVSHSIHMLQSICEKSLLIDDGEIAFAGSTVDAVNRYIEIKTQINGNNDHDEETWADLDDKNPVAIDRVEIKPVTGYEIQSGQDARINITYRSIKNIENIFWGFSIWTGDQWMCITTDLSGFSNREHRVVKGKGQFHCTLQRLPLVAGTYALKAVIGDNVTSLPLARYGWENAPHHFTVRMAPEAIDNIRAIGAGLIKMDVRWENDDP